MDSSLLERERWLQWIAIGLMIAMTLAAAGLVAFIWIGSVAADAASRHADSYATVAAQHTLYVKGQNPPVLHLASPLAVQGYPTTMSVPLKVNETDEQWVDRYALTVAHVAGVR